MSGNGRPRFRAVAFDCYGTLLNLEERAFAPALQTFLRRHGIFHVHGEAIWRHWLLAAREFAAEQGRDPAKPLEGPEPPFHTFAEAWPDYFRRAFQEHGVESISPEHAVLHLFELLSAAQPYPEVPEVIGALRRAGVAIAIASNADDVHLRPALAAAGIDADVVLSSEGVRAYKPRRPFFQALQERLALPPSEIVYAGDSPFADVLGARHAGMHAYWVRRYEDDRDTRVPDLDPCWVCPDLRGLVDVIAGPQA